MICNLSTIALILLIQLKANVLIQTIYQIFYTKTSKVIIQIPKTTIHLGLSGDAHTRTHSRAHLHTHTTHTQRVHTTHTHQHSAQNQI